MPKAGCGPVHSMACLLVLSMGIYLSAPVITEYYFIVRTLRRKKIIVT